MKKYCHCLSVLATALILLLITAPGVSAQCVTGTITAEIQLSGPYTGLYKYTIEFSWDTPQGLSNVTLDCGFECDPQLACQQTYAFDTPAGYSDGVPPPCQVEYYGEFNCSGNPSVGITHPIVKWDAIDTGSCEPGNMGSGTLCFYTNLPPLPDSPLPIIIEKDGQNVCQGIIIGDCPTLCSVPVEEASWGAVKTRFR
jgi:hypothetical protein